MASKKPRCAAKKGDGKLRCTRDAVENSLYCKQHHNKISDDSNLSSLNTTDLPSLSDFATTSESPFPEPSVQIPPHHLLDPNHTLVASLQEINEKNRKLVEELTIKTIENTNLVNENRSLKTQLDSITQQMSSMSIEYQVGQHTNKRRYKKKSLNIDDKAKRILYLEKKNDETMLAEIKGKLAQAGMLFKTKVKVYGGVKEKDLIPWQYKKAYVDYIWDQVLTEEQRQIYRAKTQT